jgi:flagellar hook assembly protein FlgD
VSTAGYSALSRALSRFSSLSAWTKVRVLLATALVVSAAPPLIGLSQADSGAQYPVQYISGGDRYFSPDGDAQEDTLPVSYYLGADAQVGWVVKDGTGSVVKTEPAAPQTPFTWHEISLDGSSDAGVLPVGQYTLDITATTASNITGTTIVDFGVTRGVIAQLTTPTAGSTLSGTTEPIALETGPGLIAGSSITSAYPQATVDGEYSSVNGTINATSLTGTIDTTNAIDGANLLSAGIGWRDPLGAFHSYSTPGVSVTIDNPVQITSAPSDHYVLPGVAGESGDVNYWLSRPATVTVTVTDATGATVATPVDGDAEVRGSQTATWDLKTAGGTDAPDGVYDVTIKATDDKTRSDSKSFKLGIWRGGLGNLTLSPSTSPVSGDLTASFAATLPPGSAVQSIFYNGVGSEPAHTFFGFPSGAPWSSTIQTNPQWGGTSFFSGAPDDDYDVTAEVSWLDPLGGYHGDTSDPTSVTVANDVQVRVSDYLVPTWVTPGRDGTLPKWTGSVAVSEPTDLTFDVKNANGDKVDSGTADGSNGFGQIDWTPPADTPDGVYSVVVTATDRTTQNTSQATLKLGVDTRSPGTISEPISMTAGDDLVFTPAAGVQPQSVLFWRDDQQFLGSGQLADDGSWHYTLQDYNIPSLGDHTVYASVFVNESFSTATLYSAKVDVTVSNSGTVTALSAGSTWFDPSLFDSLGVTYTLDSPGTTVIDLLDDQQHLVATLQSDFPAHGGSNFFNWDGTDVNGDPVPAGSYDLRVTSTGGDATVTSKTTQVTLARDLRCPRRQRRLRVPSHRGLRCRRRAVLHRAVRVPRGANVHSRQHCR